jgi:hypothetical protein
MIFIFAFIVCIWSYLLVVIHASPFLDILFLIVSGFLYLRGRYKYGLIAILFITAPLRFYVQAYLGSIWGLFEQVRNEDLKFLIDSILPTLTLNTPLFVGLILIELCLISLIFFKNDDSKTCSYLTHFQKIFPLIFIGFGIFFFYQSKSYVKPLAYLNLDKNKYYYGSVSMVKAPSVDLGKFKNKNIILFILESVGEKEYNSDRVKKIRMDLQKKYALSSLIYPNVVNIFPGTTRSHLAIHTGGLALTTGSLSEEILEMNAPPHMSLSFSEARYKTSVFSAAKWQFENLKTFYEKLKWDTFFEKNSLSIEAQKKLNENSWGYSEGPFLVELTKWFQQNSSHKKMAVFINNNTHHPYVAQGNRIYDPPYRKYSRAVDEALKNIESVIEDLEKHNQLKNTVIAITGDHGESFGIPHAENYLHRNFLYEENIHNFLDFLYIDHQRINTEVRPNTISQGDIYPTIMSLFHLGQNKSPGSSYYDYKQKLIFFHKNASPEKWGLRDSEWKYIESQYNPNDRELYNLSDDPLEQKNIVFLYPDRSETYRQLLTEWFLEKRNEFYQNTGLTIEDQMSSNDILKSITNPSIQRILLVPAVRLKEKYAVQETLATQSWALLLLSQPRGEKRTIELIFTAPSGKKYRVMQVISPEWSRVWVVPDLPRPIETGSWSVTTKDHEAQLKFNFILK